MTSFGELHDEWRARPLPRGGHGHAFSEIFSEIRDAHRMLFDTTSPFTSGDGFKVFYPALERSLRRRVWEVQEFAAWAPDQSDIAEAMRVYVDLMLRTYLAFLELAPEGYEMPQESPPEAGPEPIRCPAGPDAAPAIGIQVVVTVLLAHDDRIFLVKRSETGLLELPEAVQRVGESIADTGVRAAWETAKIAVEVTDIVGVYSDPASVSVYPDLGVHQDLVICVRARHEGDFPDLFDNGLWAMTWEDLESIAWSDRHRDVIRSDHRRFVEQALTDAGAGDPASA